MTDAALAGLLLGAAGGLKPPNLLMGFGVALAYPLARRWREGGAFAAAVAGGLLMLAFWKERTSASCLFSRSSRPGSQRESRRSRSTSTSTATSTSTSTMARADGWPPGVLLERPRREWAPVAGLVAVLRAAVSGRRASRRLARRFPRRQGDVAPRLDRGRLRRLLMPAWPAYLLLLASIPVLVPTLLRRLGRHRNPPDDRPVRPRWVALALVLTLLLPAAATAAASRVSPPTPAVVPWIPAGRSQRPSTRASP